MADSKLPSGIDRVVGQRIRWRRKELKLTQEKLGEQLGLTFQQVQKYEKGVNRISAGRLFEIARVLGVDIGFFYEGLNSDDSPLNERQRMCLDLARNFTRISNDRHQEAVSQLCRVLADGMRH